MDEVWFYRKFYREQLEAINLVIKMSYFHRNVPKS